MVFYLAGGGRQMGPGALPLPEVIRIATARGVPVVVDAAAQIPPVESLWRYAEAGADLVAVLRAARGLRGPASTGLILGRADLVERCRANAAPLQRLGRSMKVGKEDMIGILSAVELSLAEDHAGDRPLPRGGRRVLPRVGRGRGTTSRSPGSSRARPGSRCRALASRSGVDSPRSATPSWLDLYAGRPRIAVWPSGDDGIYVNPQTMVPGEEAGDRRAGSRRSWPPADAGDDRRGCAVSAVDVPEVVVERAAAGHPHAGKTLAVVTPHLDDMPIFAAGTVAKLLAEGYRGYLIRTSNDEVDSVGSHRRRDRGGERARRPRPSPRSWASPGSSTSTSGTTGWTRARGSRSGPA